MAEIFKKVDGRKITKILAIHATTQRELAKQAHWHEAVAAGILASQVHDGHSFIDVEHSNVDYYVVLNDERGQGAAMTIEFGREGGNLDVNGDVVTYMKPVAPLRKAFEIGV